MHSIILPESISRFSQRSFHYNQLEIITESTSEFSQNLSQDFEKNNLSSELFSLSLHGILTRFLLNWASYFISVCLLILVKFGSRFLQITCQNYSAIYHRIRVINISDFVTEFSKNLSPDSYRIHLRILTKYRVWHRHRNASFFHHPSTNFLWVHLEIITEPA